MLPLPSLGPLSQTVLVAVSIISKLRLYDFGSERTHACRCAFFTIVPRLLLFSSHFFYNVLTSLELS